MKKIYALSPTNKKHFLNKSNSFKLKYSSMSLKKEKKITKKNSFFSKLDKESSKIKNNPHLTKANDKILNFITNCVEKIKEDDKNDDAQITPHLADVIEKQRFIKVNKKATLKEKHIHFILNDKNKNEELYNGELTRKSIKSIKSNKHKNMSSNSQINIKNKENIGLSDNNLIHVNFKRNNSKYQKKESNIYRRIGTSRFAKEKEKEIVYNISTSLISLCNPNPKSNFTNFINMKSMSNKIKEQEKVQFRDFSNKSIKYIRKNTHISKNSLIKTKTKRSSKLLFNDERYHSNFSTENNKFTKRPSNLKRFKTFIKSNNNKRIKNSTKSLIQSLNKNINDNSIKKRKMSIKNIYEKDEKDGKKRNKNDKFNMMDWANDLKNKENLTQGEYAHIGQDLIQSLIGYEKTQLEKDLKNIESNETTELINRLPTLNNKNINSMSKFEDTLINVNIEDLNLKNNIKLNKEKFRLLQHTGYVYDSLDDEEVEDAIDINHYYIKPDSIFIYIFDSIIALFSFYCLFYFPYYLAHDSFLISTYLNIKIFIFHLIDVFFIFDLILSFFRAFYNYDEVLIKSIIEMFYHYFKNWFFLDLLAAIPFYSIFFFQEHKNINTKHYKNNLIKFHNFTFGVKLDKLYYLLFINKLLKIFKCFSNDNRALVQLVNILYKNNIVEEKSGIFFIIFILLVAIHLGSCLFIFIGRNSYPSWINEIKVENQSFSTIYIASVYYLITTITTVGYGDIYGTTIQEIIFQMILLILGTCTYSYIISSVSNFIKKINEKSLIFENRLKILNNIKLTNPYLEDTLYEKLLRFLRYKKNTEKNKQTTIINSLPYSLRNTLLIEMYKPIINNFIIFKGLENSNCIVQLVTAFKPIYGIKNDILIQEGDFIEEVIFIKTGVISLEIGIDFNKPKESILQYLNRIENKDKDKSSITMEINSLKNDTLNNNSCLNSTFLQNIKTTMRKNDKKDNKNTHYLKVLDIRKNEHFGETLMFLNERSFLTAKVKSKKADLFFLKKEEVIKVFNNFPNIWNRINKRSIYNMKQIKNVVKRVLLSFCSMSGINIYNDNNDKSISILKNEKKIKKGKKKENKESKKEIIKKENNINYKNENNSNNTLNNLNNLPNNFLKKDRKSNADKIIEKIIEEKKTGDFYPEKKSNKKFLNFTNKSTGLNDFLSNSNQFNINSLENNINTTKNYYKNDLNNFPNIKKKKNFSCFKAVNTQSELEYKTDNKNQEVENDNFEVTSKETIKLPIIKKPCSLIDSESLNEDNQILNIKFDVCGEIYNNENFNLNCEFKDNLFQKQNIIKSYINNGIKIEDLSRKILEKTWIKNLDNEKINYLGKLINKSIDNENSNISDDKSEKKKSDKSFSSSNIFINLKKDIVESFIIHSSYENINKITKDTYIKNNKLREKTKNFLLKEYTFFLSENKINENKTSTDANFDKSALFEPKFNLKNKNKLKKMDSEEINKSAILPKRKKEMHKIKNRGTMKSFKNMRTVSTNRINTFSKNMGDKKRPFQYNHLPRKLSRSSSKNVIGLTKKNQKRVSFSSSTHKEFLNKSVRLHDNDDDISFYEKYNINNFNNDNIDNQKLLKKRKKQEDTELEEISHIIKQDAQNLNDPSLFYQNFFINQIRKRRGKIFIPPDSKKHTLFPNKRNKNISIPALDMDLKRTSTDAKNFNNKFGISFKKK